MTESAAPTFDGEVSGLSALSFEEIELPGFRAEVALGGPVREDYIIHFYPPGENTTEDYWLKIFPEILSEFSQQFFADTFPALKASYTEENASWWFRAYGKARTLFVTERILRFFQELSAKLPTETSSQ